MTLSVDPNLDTETPKKRKRGRPKSTNKQLETDNKKLKAKKLTVRSTVKNLGIGPDQTAFIRQLFHNTQKYYVSEERFCRKISKDAVNMIDNLTEVLLTKLIKNIQDIITFRKKKGSVTLTPKITYEAVRMCLPQDVQAKICDCFFECIQKYRASKANAKGEGEGEGEGEEEVQQTQEVVDEDFNEENPESSKIKGGVNFSTGLTLRPTRFQKKMRERCSFDRMSAESCIVVTAAIEFMIKKVILMTLLYMLDECPGTINSEGKIIQPKLTSSHIRIAIQKFDQNKKPVIVSQKIQKRDLPDSFGGEGVSHLFSNVIWTQTRSMIPVLST